MNGANAPIAICKCLWPADGIVVMVHSFDGTTLTITLSPKRQHLDDDIEIEHRLCNAVELSPHEGEMRQRFMVAGVRVNRFQHIFFMSRHHDRTRFAVVFFHVCSPDHHRLTHDHVHIANHLHVKCDALSHCYIIAHCILSDFPTYARQFSK